MGSVGRTPIDFGLDSIAQATPPQCHLLGPRALPSPTEVVGLAAK